MYSTNRSEGELYRNKELIRFQELQKAPEERLYDMPIGQIPQINVDAIQGLNVGVFNEVVALTNDATIMIGGKKNSRARLGMTNRMHGLTPFLTQIAAIGTPKMQSSQDLMQKVMIDNEAISHYFLPFNHEGNINTMRKYFNQLKDERSVLTYDTETLGGVDQFGAKRFFGITEFGYSVHQLGDDIETTLANTKRVLLGIDEKAYKELYSEIKNGGFYHRSDMGKVVGRRLALYANADTQINRSANTWHVERLANLPDNYIPTQEELLRGLDVLHNAYLSDQKTKGPNQLSQGQIFLRDMYSLRKEMITAGHNTLRSDRYWEIAQLGRYSSGEREAILNGFTFKDERHLDSLAIGKAGAYYKNTAFLTDTVRSEKGALTLEELGSIYLGKNFMEENTSHEAGFDSAVLATLFDTPFFHRAFGVIPENTTGHQITPGKQLFYNTGSYSTRGQINPLNFKRYNNGELRVNNGYTLTNDGRIVEDIFDESPMRKNGLYTLDQTGIIKLDQQTRESLGLINSDYDMEELYWSAFNPYDNEPSVTSLSQSVFFYRSKEERDAHFAQMQIVGESDGKGSFVQAKNMDARLLQHYNLETQEVETQTWDDFIMGTQNKMRTNKVNNYVNNLSYKDAMRIKSVHEEVEKNAADQITGPITRLMQTRDNRIAAVVASGAPITLDMGLDSLNDIIGHLDQSYSKEVNRVYGNTYEKMFTLSEYFGQNRNVISQVTDFVNERYKDDDPLQMEYAFSSIMRTLTNQANNNGGYGAQSSKILNGLEANYVEVDMRGLNSIRKVVPMAGPNSGYREFARINLENPNASYNLISSLMKHKFGTENPWQNTVDYDTQSLVVLQELMGELGMTEDAKNAKNYSPVHYADRIVDFFRSRKKEDPFYGIHKRTENGVVGTPGFALDTFFQNSGLNLADEIKRASQDVPTYRSLLNKYGKKDGYAIDQFAKQIVSSFTDQMDPNLYFGNKAYSQDQARYLTHIYEDAQLGYVNYMKQFLHTYADVENAAFFFDDKSKRFGVKMGETTLDLTDKLPRLKLYGDMSYMQLGGTDLALTGAILPIRNAPLKVEVGSSARKWFQEASKYMGNQKYRIENGYVDMQGSVQSVMTQLGQQLRSVSNVSARNKSEKRSNAFVDIQYAFNVLPMLHEKGLINLSEQELDEVNGFLRNGEELLTFGDSTSYLRNIYSKNTDSILTHLLGGKKADSIESFVLLNAGPYTEENKFGQGYMDVFGSHQPFSKYMANRRITLGKNNFISYRIGDVKERLGKIYGADYEKQGIFAQAAYQTAYGKTLSTGKFGKFMELDTKLSNEIVAKKLVTSHQAFAEVLDDYLKKNSDVPDVVKQVLSSAAIIEDSTIFDPRLLDAVFTHDPNRQHFSFKKDLSTEIDDAESLLFKDYHNAMYNIGQNDDGSWNFKYGEGSYRRKNDELYRERGFLDVENTVNAKYNGYLKMGFLAGEQGFTLNENEVTQLINNRNFTSEDDVRKYLSSLESVFYLEEEGAENYRKLYTAMVEKSKSYAPIVPLGKQDRTIESTLRRHSKTKEQQTRLDRMLGKVNKYDEIESLVQSFNLGQDEEEMLMKKISNERYYAWNVIRGAFDMENNEEFHYLSAENQEGHVGISQSIQETILNMRQYHVDQGQNAQQAARSVVANLKGLPGFGSIYEEDGDIVFQDTESAPDIEREKFVEQIKGVYGDYFEDSTYEENGKTKRFFGRHYQITTTDQEGRTVKKNIGTITSTTLAANEEHNRVSGRMPLEYVDQIYEQEQKIQAKKTEVSTKEAEVVKLQEQIKQFTLLEKNNQATGVGSKETSLAIKDKIIELTSNIQDLQKEIGVLTDSKKRQEIGYLNQHKGATYGEREVLALANYKYNKERMQSQYNRVADATSDFIAETFFGKDYATREFTDKRMLTNVISAVKDEILHSSAYELLDETNVESIVKQNFKNPSIRKHLINMFELNKGSTKDGKIALEHLQTRYALEMSARAITHNKIDQVTSIVRNQSKEELIKLGFEPVNVRNYQLSQYSDSSFIEGGNSIFSKNILLNVRGQEIAVPYMPHSTYNQNIVQRNLERQIEIIKKADFEMDKYEVGSGKYESHLKKMNLAIEQLKKDVTNVTSKDSVVSMALKPRADQSVYVGASALIPRIEKEGQKIISNDQDLVNAVFNGRSVQQWYDDGIFVNAAFAGDAVFEEMGFFSKKMQDEFLEESYFKDGKRLVDVAGKAYDINEDDVTATIKKVLSEQGVATIDTRFPNIQHGSSTAGMLYYSYDETSKDRVRYLLGAHKRKGGDYDGDKVSFRIAKFSDQNTNGAFTSLQIGTKHQDKTYLMDGFKDAMKHDAVGMNAMWEQLSRDSMSGEMQRTINQNLFSISSDRTFEGKLVSEYVYNPKVTFTDNQIYDSIRRMESLQKEATKQGIEFSYENPEAIADLINNLDIDDVEKSAYKEAYRNKLSLDFREITRAARTFKDSIGEINNPMFELRQVKEVLEMTDQISNRQAGIIQDVLYPVEQVPISAKNIKSAQNDDITKQLANIVNSAFSGKPVAGRPNESFEEVVDDFLENVLKPSYISKYGIGESEALTEELLQRQASSGVTESAKKAFAADQWQNTKDNFMSFLSMLDNDNLRNARGYFKLNSRTDKTTEYTTTESAFSGVIDDDVVFSAKNLIMNLQFDGESIYKQIDTDSISASANLSFAKAKVDYDMLDAASQSFSKNVGQFDVSKILSDVNTKTGASSLAVGALAAAGAYMLVGAFGTSVTANTTNQAEGAMPTQSTLSDYGSDYEYTSQNTGYVINMSGSTNHENLQKVIGNVNQSLSQSTNANMQMTLNINETPLKDFQINRLVENALRF